ncbi:Uncharacterized protein TPAR_08710 [Tolypocladium paradoxum]|uniref:Protein (Fungal and plant) n=1 Tax=Tolypocladium paradoxum TaxID=94208 RepID=A0A2S4KLY6_9HYPO|nr:Uncharacterized protein TPAR_08710 [Tolypocladium paradoxum]
MAGKHHAPDSPEPAANMGAQDQEVGSKDTQPRRRRQRRQWTLPAWLQHFNAQDLKILFRCCAATWVATVLIFIQPALHSIGVATFFGALVLYVVPPASILFVYLLAALSLLFGMCLAWAWGLLTMRAALAARPDSETQAMIRALQRQAAAQAKKTGQSVALEAQILVSNGFMLDARVTAVFFVMCCLFVYAAARLRCRNPKLVLLQLFGTIVIDLFLLFGPTVPKFTGNLAWILVKPGAIGIGLGAACCLLFFPQSTSYVVLDKMEKLVRMAETPLDSTRRRLANEAVPLDQLRAARGGMIAVYKAMGPALAFLPLDFSRGLWSADDVQRLQERVREAMLASLSLLDLHIARTSAEQKQERLEMQQAAQDAAATGTASEKDGHGAGHHQLLESAHLINALRNPEQGAMHDRAMQALEGATSEVLRVCSQSVRLAARCIQTVNACRWMRKPSQQKFDELAQELQDTLATLRSAKAACVTNTAEAVLESHADIFNKDGQLKSYLPGGLGPPSLRGIVVSMVIEERILGTAEAMEKLLEHLLLLANARTAPRIWIPSRLQYAVSWLFNGRLSVSVSGTSTDAADDPDNLLDPAALEEQAREAHRRLLRISRGYDGLSARRSRFSRALVGTFKWLTNPSGMYALRMVVVTVATSIPAAIPHSAGFYYREKGIWGVITAQTCLLVYMADFTFSVVSRGLGTVIGGVMGMVAWYIGSGSGPGNPYGMGASTAVMTVILMWWRVFLPPAYAQASIMSGATFALVVGYSYDQHHIQQYGPPGQGYAAFWKRLVTVLLGFVAAFVVQLFPKPPSATRHVCKTLANTVRTLSDHYALLLSHWGRTDQNSPLGAVAKRISLDIAETLISLNGAIRVLKVELSFGPFDQKVLGETKEQCQYMNQSLGRLLDLSTSLPKALQDRLAHSVGILDDRAIGDIMAVLGIIEQSLRTGSPLPERLPAPLIRRFFDSWHAQNPDPLLSRTLVLDEQYRRYCVAMSSYLNFLSVADDLVLVLKGALGECHVIHQWADA